jgi:kynurenine formamidase
MIRPITSITPEVRASEEEAERELLSLSNWGRWGEDDELGALNLVDLAAVQRGMAAVKTGKVYSLSQLIGPTSPRGEARPPNQLFMAIDGGDFASGSGNFQSAGRGAAPFRVGDEAMFLTTHNGTTHLDALSHYWVDDEMYNGFSGKTVSSAGASKLGIENMAGMFTRAVLLDMARYRGVEICDPWDYFTAEDVAGCCEAEGVTVQSGDAVLIHTGWPEVYEADPVKYRYAQPGLGSSGALFLVKAGMALVGADNTGIHGYGARKYPLPSDPPNPKAGLADLHVSLLRNLGIYMLEMMDLARLAADAAFESLLAVAPLLVKGATGAPVNPIAVA